MNLENIIYNKNNLANHIKSFTKHLVYVKNH